MQRPMLTVAVGTSLQELAERAWEGPAAGSDLYFEGQVFTGAELAARVRRIAQGLRDAGLGAGDRVVVCMANCPEVGLTYQAVWRAGGVLTPVLFLLSPAELHHVLTDSGATFLVTTSDLLPSLLPATQGCSGLRAVVVCGGVEDSATEHPLIDFQHLEAAAEGQLVQRSPSDLAALLYTGGTTGRAKGVMLTHDALSSAAWAAIAAEHETGAEPTTTWLLPLPLSHIYGLILSVMGLHATEPGTTVLMRWFQPLEWLQLVERHRVDASAVVPSMIQMLLAQPLEDFDLTSLRQVFSGAAPLPRDVAEAFLRRVPQVELSEGYGCTESAAIISTSPSGTARLGSVGRAPAPIAVRIERADGSEAAAGEDGEICVRGPNVMAGYWNAPEETARVLRGGWLHTGDVGRMDADGHVYVVDRIKDTIIRGGFNVYPRDVEDALLEHPEIVGAGVVGRPDPSHGEEIVAFVQLAPESRLTPDDVVAFARRRLSATKYPREVRIVDSLPLTSVLKLDRKTLRSRVSAS